MSPLRRHPPTSGRRVLMMRPVWMIPLTLLWTCLARVSQAFTLQPLLRPVVPAPLPTRTLSSSRRLPRATTTTTTTTALFLSTTPTNNKESNNNNESAFVPLETKDSINEMMDTDDDTTDDDLLDKVELFGKGAAKVKRGKRKGEAGATSSSSSSKQAVKASLAPEQVFYEGPPAITETLAPTLSIVTVVGLIPAAAAWARQAWVRYKITNRRIRVTSGLNGQDMAEIVYPDIVEVRTVRRLFGDGDLVAFLRDGAKFEMRNIPNFLATMEFVLTHIDPDVVAQYRAKGDVTNGRPSSE